VLAAALLSSDLTKLTGLERCCVAEKALLHLSLLSKLQHLHLNSPWAAANFPGLQELTGLTSLALYYGRHSLPASISRLTALQQLEVSSASVSELNGLMRLTALTKLHVVGLTPEPTALQLPDLQHLHLKGCLSEVLPFSYPVMHMSCLASCTQLQRLSLQAFRLTGSGSLVASSMLQELDLNECVFSLDDDLPASSFPWEAVFPGPGQLPHLTSLVLQAVGPSPVRPDVQLQVACCSGLRVLQHCSLFLDLANVSDVQSLHNLTKLHGITVSDETCCSLAQLTELRELQVVDPLELSSVGLRHLARLEQLTSLSFCRSRYIRKLSIRLQILLSDSLQGRRSGGGHAIVNTVRGLVAWCSKALMQPPGVARSLQACDHVAACAHHAAKFAVVPPSFCLCISLSLPV